MSVELTTDRLRLRTWQHGDFEPLAAFLMDSALARYRGGAKSSRDEAWDFMCAQLGQWDLRGYGVFAITDRQTGNVFGYSGLWHPLEWDEPELSYSLFGAAHGNGYATEAATRVRQWAAHDLGLSPLFSMIHPDNTPSIKVAERLGAAREGELPHAGEMFNTYRHPDLLGAAAA
ncbi:MAG: GNAT family N-acetyltransferase [Pseudomonadota bacterium]